MVYVNLDLYTKFKQSWAIPKDRSLGLLTRSTTEQEETE